MLNFTKSSYKDSNLDVAPESFISLSIDTIDSGASVGQ